MTRADAVDRRIMRMISIGMLLLLPAAIGELRSQTGAVAAWWSVGAAALLVLSLLVLAVSRVPLGALRVGSSVYPLLSVLVSASWFFAHDGGAATTAPWTWTLEPAGVVLAAMAWRPAVAVGYALLAPLSVAAGSWLAHGAVSPDLAMAVALHLGNVLFGLIVMAARHQLGVVWEAGEQAAAQQRALAETRAWSAERARMAALVHDEILATLTAAARSDGSDSAQVADQAARAIALLDGRTGAAGTGQDVSPRELVGELRALSASYAAAVEAEVVPGCPGLPRVVADQVLAAVAEALRNSVRHARPVSDRVRRVARVQLTAEELRVEVVDDGTGFVPERTPPTRLGLRGSITARMTSVDGGSAQVRSAPGQGTTVTMTWRRP